MTATARAVTLLALATLAATLPGQAPGKVLPLAADFSAAEPGEALPGGATTHSRPADENAFSWPAANMPPERELDFKVGNGFFRRLWVSAPASTGSADGLGPLYNARSCQHCHLKDGRGHPPNGPDDNAVSMLLRLSIPASPGQPAEASPFTPEPTYGAQLQDFSIQGQRAEGRIAIHYEPVVVEMADGTRVELRAPRYAIADPGYGPLHPQLMISPRIAPQMIGLGLLEAIADADLNALADPDDRTGDGISGRVNRVWSRAQGQWVIGRFGAKASAPSIDEQVQSAFNGDIGISTPLFPSAVGDCTPRQPACLAAPHGNSPGPGGLEAGETVTRLVAFYSRNLAVPARRDADDPAVLRGKRIFYTLGCAACHHPGFETRRDSIGAEQSAQRIWPYTDLLLHDMGEGLADHRPVAGASGREWRTAPLWGIGLVPVVNGHSYYLHDGRARNLTEAILWHGGEAERQQQAFTRLERGDRDHLIRFLESL
jgi:CxxC motif-containing protein (DUF1111 family)